MTHIYCLFFIKFEKFDGCIVTYIENTKKYLHFWECYKKAYLMVSPISAKHNFIDTTHRGKKLKRLTSW